MLSWKRLFILNLRINICSSNIIRTAIFSFLHGQNGPWKWKSRNLKHFSLRSVVKNVLFHFWKRYNFSYVPAISKQITDLESTNGYVFDLCSLVSEIWILHGQNGPWECKNRNLKHFSLHSFVKNVLFPFWKRCNFFLVPHISKQITDFESTHGCLFELNYPYIRN